MFFSIKSYLRIRIALAGVMAVIFAFAPLFSIPDTQAAIPQTINYQSRLLTPGGLPVTSTTAIQLSFYLHPTNGSSGDVPDQAGPLVWKEVYDQASGACAMITPDAKGYFFLKLGSCSPFPSYLDFSEIMYVGVKIGADAEASPRVQLSSHPYALNAYRLNGYEATSTATANQLLALDSDLNFNIDTGTFTGAGLFISGTSTLQQVTFTVATGTSLNLTEYLAIGAIRLDAIGTNNQTSGAYLVGVFDEFDNSNATTVQAALFDLDQAITTVSSTLYAMDLQLVTDNGNITTNWIEFAGGTTTGDILPSDNSTQNLGAFSKRWSEVYTDWLSLGDWNWWLGQNVDQGFGIYGTAEHFTVATSGNVGVNTTAPVYQLDVDGITRSRGQLIMGRSILLPLAGAEVGAMLWQGFNNAPYYWDGTQWQRFANFNDLASNWSLSGNFATDPSTNYIGTADAQPLVFRTNLLERMRLDATGNLGIGTSTPAYRVDILGDARVNAQFMLGQYAVLPALGEQSGAMVYSTVDSVPYYWDGTQWIAFATGTNLGPLDLQAVTDYGNTTTNQIVFAGGTSTASLEVTGELSINGIKLSAPGIDGLTSGAYLVGTFDEFANFNATTVQAALKAIDAMLTFGSASTSVFVGLTSGSYDGAFNYSGKVGYQAANDICAAEYAGSHFCRTDEVIATIAAVDISALFVATTFGWIAEGPPGYTANSNDCAGYTTNSNTSLGAFWAYDPNGGGMGWLNNCQVTRKISCCR
jgi:hypothetical protein